MLTTVRVRAVPLAVVYQPERFLQHKQLSRLQIGTIIFRLKLPESRENIFPFLFMVRADHICTGSSFNSTLINGKGRYPGGPQVPLAVVNVVQHKRSVLGSAH